MLYFKKMGNQRPVSALFQKIGKPAPGFCFISKRLGNQLPVSALFQKDGKPAPGFCFISKDWENQGPVSAFFQKDEKNRARFLPLFKKVGIYIVNKAFFLKKWNLHAPIPFFSKYAMN